MISSFDYRTEQRQHLALSQYAYNTVINDSFMFLEKENISGFINRIFENYYQDSAASISLNIKKKRDHYAALFRRGRIPDTDRIIQLLNEDYCKELQKKLNLAEKDVPLKIRLNNSVYDILYPDCGGNESWPEQPYYKNPGSYLKAGIEDYARLSLFEREQVFYKEFIVIIQNELDHQTEKKRILQLDYLSAANQPWHFNIKPYALMGDKERNYNYLVGYSCKAGTNEDYRPGAFRLSRILSIRPHGITFGSGKITKENEKKLLDEIEEKGVQFLMQKQEETTVRLTAAGRKMFKSQLSLRPIPIKDKTKELEDGGMELHFNATPAQIQFYFFKFGKEARILSPEFLADSFTRKYKEAFESYNTEDREPI